MTCDKTDVDKAMEIYKNMLKKSQFSKQAVLTVLSNLAASTNGIVHSTKQQCNIAVLETLCAKDSPLYMHTPLERMQNIKNVNGADLQSFMRVFLDAPTQVGTINYSKEKRKQIISQVCTNTKRASPSSFDKSTEVSNNDVLFFKVPSSGSYTLNIGQPVHGVSGSDNAKVSQLMVANKIMSNSFNGRLMRKLRTEKSLTYGASSLIQSSGSDPLMMMTAAFSPEHVKEGMQMSRQLLNEFSNGELT